MRKFRYLFLAVIVLGLALAYNNCSDANFEFSAKEAASSGDLPTDPGDVPPGVPQDPPGPVVCDPFSSGAMACHGGITGEIYYLSGSSIAAYQNLPASQKSVNYLYNNGVKVDATLNLNQLFISTRDFNSGFPLGGGGLVKDASGATLTEYFAFKLQASVKLDVGDAPGYYQFGVLSDDGTVLSVQDVSNGPYQTFINNDGDHATKLGCASQTIHLDVNESVGIHLDYYQGPKEEIALVLLWRKVADPQNIPNESLCGVVGDSTYFGPRPYSAVPDITKYGYGQLVSHGWKVLGSGNFVSSITN